MKNEQEPTIKDVLIFLYEHMPTKQEINERFDQLPTKAQYHTLVTSVDGLAKNTLDYYTEVQSLRQTVSDIEKWLKEVAAPKLGVEYKR